MCVLRTELKIEALNANRVCLFLSWRLTLPLASTVEPAVGLFIGLECACRRRVTSF